MYIGKIYITLISHLMMFIRDVITNDVSLANTFTNKEPAANFNSNQHVDPSIPDSQLLPAASAERGEDVVESRSDLSQFTRLRWG